MFTNPTSLGLIFLLVYGYHNTITQPCELKRVTNSYQKFHLGLTMKTRSNLGLTMKTRSSVNLTNPADDSDSTKQSMQYVLTQP